MTITDKGITSAFSLAEVRFFANIFSRNTQVLLASKGQDKAYKVHALMTKNLSDFFKWYITEADVAVSSLIIELLNTQRQAIRTFRIS